MGRMICLVCFLACVTITTGCHYDGHDESGGSSVDGTRRKRTTATAGNPNITVIGFFPTCIEQRLNESSPSDDSTSTKRAWRGPISYILYHSRWYKKVNQTCWGVNDTVECWINNVVNVVRGKSRTLRAAQECVVDYYEEYHGIEEYDVDEFPEGTAFEDNSNCTDVDVLEYKEQLTPYLTSEVTYENQDDVTFTQENIDDVLAFAKDHLYCPDCTCDDLAEVTEYLEAFEYDEDCSSCWYTTFATELTDESDLRDEISELAFAVGGFQQKETCPVDYGIDFSTESITDDLLAINISCGVDKIVIDMNSCGLVQLGYRKADEVFVTSPQTPIADIYTIAGQCTSKIKKKTDNKIATVKFPKDKCDGEISINETHSRYDFALRNRRPEVDLYEDGIALNRRVYIDFRFTCVYPSLTKSVGLPFGITTVQRSIMHSLKTNQEPLQVTMSAFRDEDFLIPFASNDSTVMVPDPIWIKVTHNGAESAVIDIPSCWMIFPEINTQEEHSVFIVVGGCPFKENNGTGSLDGAYSLNTCTSNVASFMFYSFYFANNSLQINCDVDVFETMPSHCIDRECNTGIVPARRRRNASTKLDLTIKPGIRECDKLTRLFCKCDHICACDSTGRPLCLCHRGYTLTDDGRTCI